MTDMTSRDGNLLQNDACDNILRPDAAGQYPPEPRKEICDMLGVWVLSGCDIVDAGCFAEKIEGMILSARQMRIADAAYRIDCRGKRSIRWKTALVPSGLDAEKGVVFVFCMAMGTGSPLPQTSSVFTINIGDLAKIRFQFVKHTEVWKKDGVSFCFQVSKVVTAPAYRELTIDKGTMHESAASYGWGLIDIEPGKCEAGRPLDICVTAGEGEPSARWFRIDTGTSIVKGSRDYGILTEANYWQGLLAVSGRIKRRRSGKYEIFFGDIHTHSGSSFNRERQGCGVGTPEENYEYARDVSNLDFYALSEHDWQVVNNENWGYYKDLARKYDQDGRFTTLLSYEWGLEYGQRNVYYEYDDQPFFSSVTDAKTPAELWKNLLSTKGRAITIPHHPSWSKSPLDLNYYEPVFDRLFEVYSSWGCFEHDEADVSGIFDRFEGRCFREVLSLGRRYGAIASSDGHDGHPGSAQGMPHRHPHLYHFLGSGRTAVLAESHTRSSIFDALYDRRVYATTGEHIVISFSVEGVVMGGEVRLDDIEGYAQIEVGVLGTVKISRVLVIRTGIIAHIQYSDTSECSFIWKDHEYDSAGYYYIRVEQEDGESAWSSPVWITG